MPAHCLKKLYYGLVHPKILYGIEVYANTHKTYLEKLKILNNKIIRVITKAVYRTPTLTLYKSLNTLPIDKLHEFNLLLLVHKYFYHKHLLPPVFQKYFTLSHDIHNHNTRSASDLYLLAPNNEKGKKPKI